MLINGAIEGAAFQQLLVGALGRDAPLLHDDDPVGRKQRGNPVRDQDTDPARQPTAKILDDMMLSVGIDGGESVVDDDDGTIQQQGPGQGEALALAAGEEQSLLPHP